MAMGFIIDRSEEAGVGRIVLTVNRRNENAISLYGRHGFRITGELVNGFENGHTVLDYEMTRFKDKP